jgi:hypothetical protein
VCCPAGATASAAIAIERGTFSRQEWEEQLGPDPAKLDNTVEWVNALQWCSWSLCSYVVARLAACWVGQSMMTSTAGGHCHWQHAVNLHGFAAHHSAGLCSRVSPPVLATPAATPHVLPAITGVIHPAQPVTMLEHVAYCRRFQEGDLMHACHPPTHPPTHPTTQPTNPC